MKNNLLLHLIFFFPVFVMAKLPERKSTLVDIPADLNQKAIAACFEKLVGVVTVQDASNLNSLRVTLERIYQLPKPFLLMRQLEFKKESGKKVIFEFNALENSKPGAENYSVKNYSLNSKGKIEESVGPSVNQVMTRVQVDKFVTDDEIVRDDRIEEYKTLNSRSIRVKSSNFKVQEIESYDSKTKKQLNCRILVEQQPLCQCL